MEKPKYNHKGTCKQYVNKHDLGDVIVLIETAIDMLEYRPVLHGRIKLSLSGLTKAAKNLRWLRGY